MTTYILSMVCPTGNYPRYHWIVEGKKRAKEIALFAERAEGCTDAMIEVKL